MKSTFWSFQPFPLGHSEAHLWYVFPETITTPELLASYHSLICPKERTQQRRFNFEKGRHQYLVTRALVRTTLSRYVPVDPGAWRFENNSQGRPEIVYPQSTLPLRFNVSHTDGLIVCLVAMDREVGVDVEDMTRPGQTVEIANQFFSPTEVAALRALAGGAQRHRFFEYWTLKEAYIKARGIGVSLPLEWFSFHLEPGRPVRISFDPSLDDDPLSWQFAQFRLTPRHIGALAIRRRAGSDLDVQVRRTVPLVF